MFSSLDIVSLTVLTPAPWNFVVLTLSERRIYGESAAALHRRAFRLLISVGWGNANGSGIFGYLIEMKE